MPKKSVAPGIAGAYSEEIEGAPKNSCLGEPSSFEDTIIMQSGWPHMDIDFDLRIDLDERCQQILKEDLCCLLGHFRRFREDPKRVIIGRPTADPKDSRIIAVIRSQTGQFLGSIIGEANGTGMLTFTPASK